MKAVTFFLALLLPSVVFGQDQSDPASTARMHFGPLALTATVSPQTELWLRLGKGRSSGRARLDDVYFSRYETERAVNTYDDVRIQLPLNRLTPYVSESFLNARERPGYEIDARSRHVENTLTLGTDVRVGPKTTVGISAWRTKIKFNADEVFLGTYLSEVLNRTADGLRASVRHRLTLLTTFVIDAEAQRDRFEFSSVRNSDSVRIMPGLDPGVFALISGSGCVGFSPRHAARTATPAAASILTCRTSERFVDSRISRRLCQTASRIPDIFP